MSSSKRETDLDNLIRLSLAGALRNSEPSPHVWDQIKYKLAVRPRRYSLRRFVNDALDIAARLEHFLFSVPGWHYRLADHRMDLMTRVWAYQGTGTISLAVV